MILTTTRHGRTKRDVKNLLAHLSKQLNQTSRVIRIDGVPVSNADDAMKYMQAMRDASRATVACHHISISPRIRLTDEQVDEAVQRILSAMGAEDHAYVLWKHSEKARASDDVADEHYHLVVGHIGPDGRALRDSMSFARLEAAGRTLEVDFNEPLTPSRMTSSVAKELRRIGRDDVADMLTKPPTPPTSAMSSRTRAKADRQGLDLPAAQADVRAAWAASDGPSAFRAALAQSGYEVHPGKRPSVFAITKNGIDVGALDRIVKEKRAAVAARMKEEENDRSSKKAPQREGSDLSRSPRRPSIIGEAVAAAQANRRRRFGRPGPDRRDQGSLDRDYRNPREAKSGPRSHQKRLRENVAAARLRGSDFHALRMAAKAVASGRDVRTPRRRLKERAAIVSFRSIGFADVAPIVAKVAAGSMLDHSDLDALMEARMKTLKPAKALDYKATLLAEIAPRGFDASAFSNDIHMVKMPGPGRSTARVMTRDGGWIEIDTKSGKAIRTWGNTGRANVIAQALANVLGVEVEHRAKTVSVGADAEALHVTKLSEDKVKSLTMWWAALGYVAVAASDGCWIDAGHSRIKDVGDHLEIHGGLTDEAIAVTLLKAKEAWGGGVYLDGRWTPAEQDRIWIAAQRQGIDVANCAPSAKIQAAWQREQDAAAKNVRTISSVRSAIADAADLRDAAAGDDDAMGRLPEPLQAFVSSYLDDDQRKELATKSVADVAGALPRFRQLGADELATYERRTGRKFVAPKPRRRDNDRDRDNENGLDM
ncbi:relaxase/mobilization nuclease domain-containing protein [Rhodopseudomonas sp. BR0G17]|uniref:relaxase/mobilization nuclease domain-containing protein n=1 Tax=Rhodopseudomonas sp. BR0G17 TaxID=2269368 RepID=UPI0013DF6AF0|nr:relaxase/mobilization nuclease domain-containing protein [Rhodopseudomonas sp. BR0G17]NEW98628.1 hypothetical protein [Rhodopseudomonas sp. BR0G17]